LVTKQMFKWVSTLVYRIGKWFYKSSLERAQNTQRSLLLNL
jgi:hypothetical protein